MGESLGLEEAVDEDELYEAMDWLLERQSRIEKALALRGRVAVANAKLAYGAFRETFSGPRWEALVARGARVQRPLWASTSTKNEAYPDTLYVDELIGPDTVNTLPVATLEAFRDHGQPRTSLREDLGGAEAVFAGLAGLGCSTVAVSTCAPSAAGRSRTTSPTPPTLPPRSAAFSAARKITCRVLMMPYLV